MPSKPRVWSGFIVCPAYQITHGLNLIRTDSRNPSRANERSGIEDRRSGFFSESYSIHPDSFITWRNQMQMRGCMRAMGASAISNSSAYIILYIPTYAMKELHLPQVTGFIATLVGAVILGVVSPFAGHFSD